MPPEEQRSTIAEKPFMFPIAGLVFGLFIWIIDAIVDVILLDEEQNLLQNIFTPEEASELWMRSLVLLVFIIMGFYSRHVLLKHIELDRTLLNYQKKLENTVTERTQSLLDKARELEILASTDTLTGLYNRRKFTEILNLELERFQRYQQPFCIISIDIDHFKKINDTHGHDVGDQVLKQFSAILKSSIRRSDSAGRWGGEEFVLLIIESNRQQGVQVAENLKTAFNEMTYDIAGKVTASIGVTEVIKSDLLDDIVKRSDQALYTAKDKGRNRIEVLVQE